MAKSDFVFEEGDPFDVGEQGENDILYSKGDPVTDRGLSTFVFEAGVGLRGVSAFVVDGTNVGFYESNETHSSFYDADFDAQPHAQGLDAEGIDDQPNTDTAYIFGHHDTGNDTFAIGIWLYEDSDPNHEARIDFSGDTGNVDTVLVQDDLPSDSVDSYGTSPPYGAWSWGGANGDGGMWSLDNGSYDLTLTIGDTNIDDSENFPDQFRGRGPLDSISVSGGLGASVDVSVTV